MDFLLHDCIVLEHNFAHQSLFPWRHRVNVVLHLAYVKKRGKSGCVDLERIELT